MTGKRKRYSADFKAKVALEALKGELTLSQLATKHGVHQTMIAGWRKQAVEGLAGVFSGKAEASDGLREGELDNEMADATREIVGREYRGQARPLAQSGDTRLCFQISQKALRSRGITADVLELLPLNEALMEVAEERSELPATHLREERTLYTPAFAGPPVAAIIAAIAARGYVYPPDIIRSYHVALHTKPLVILPGISGTGKTRLTRLYADAVHSIAPGADNPYYLAVAVQPDWHNARDLLGYYNALTERFQPTPTLCMLLRAAADPANPYFICLDEMNLARPEYYLCLLYTSPSPRD